MSSTSAGVDREVSEAKVEETTMAVLTPNWLDLPTELTSKILQMVGLVDVLENAQLVCTQWHCISMNPLFWSNIHTTTRLSLLYVATAIKRSCGQVVDISIARPTLSVLRRIANNGSNLRRMRLERCYPSFICDYPGISDDGLREAAKKLAVLEELEILGADLSMNCIETIGQSCPLLKVLKIIKKRKKIEGIECDDDALTIAKTMPNLRHLTLLGNRLTNVGLLAILNGCPRLESLDLRGCLNLNLEETSLWKRSIERIKELRLPNKYLAESSDDEPDLFTIEYALNFGIICCK